MNGSAWFRVLAGCAISAAGLSCTRAAEDAPRLRIATWNVEWFYDDDRGDNESDLAKSQSAPSRDAWQWKLAEVTRVVAELRPDILALQEIENRRVLMELVQQLRDVHNLRYRVAYIEGGDVFTEQDVGILYRGDLLAFSRQEQSEEMFRSNQYYNVQKHLFARFRFRYEGTSESLTILTAHLRARSEQEAIRRRQSNLLHTWVREEAAAHQNVVVLGDFNTEHAHQDADASKDLGVLRGLHTDDPQDDLFDLHERLPENERATHLSGRQYDHILISRAMYEDAEQRRDWSLASVTVRRDLVVRGRGPDRDHFDNYWGIAADERDVSDHYPVIAEFELR